MRTVRFVCRYDDTWMTFWEITGHFGKTHDEHRDGPWWAIRLVLVVRYRGPETSSLQTFIRLAPRSVLRTTARDAFRFGHFTWWLKRSPGRSSPRAVVSKTAHLDFRIAPLTVNRKFPKIWYFGLDTYFDARGITISPPWEHSSSNVIQVTWSIEYE